MHDRSDEELLAKIGQGDEAALKELFERYHVRLYNFILRTVGEDMLAEDVFQETFIRLAQKAGTYQPRAKAVTWIYRIAYNLSIDALRRSKRLLDYEEISEQLPDYQRLPYEVVLQNQQRLMLKDALDQLSAPQRAVILLAVIEERSQLEIAEMTGVPVGTVKSRLHYALRRLEQLLRPHIVEL
ncbi:MAG TPA: RNA polymerase sigma factor [Anaerolineae bacterium]|jgi:RNA polymerase sigma-70 factor (ECF subfamily)